MTFSITGNLLSGTSWRPAVALRVFVEKDSVFAPPNGTQKSQYNFEVADSYWNLAGRIPIVSTFSGLAKALVATVHAVIHLFAAIVTVGQQRQDHWQETILGVQNLFDGVIEMVPLLGNAVRYISYGQELEALHAVACEKIRNNREAYSEQAVLFANNRELQSIDLPADDQPQLLPLELADVYALIQQQRQQHTEQTAN
jgi:hypothetical protein